MATAAQPRTPPIDSIDTDSATALLATRGLTVQGRTFAIVTHPTFRQAAYLEKWRTAAAIDEMLAHFDPAADADVSPFVAKLIMQSFENDAIFHLVAGGIVEVVRGAPAKWTREKADALAEWIAELDQPEDQAALHRAILGVLASFFLSRIVAAAASPSSLDATKTASTRDADDPSPNPPPPPSHASTPSATSAGPVDLADRILASAPPTEPPMLSEAHETASASAPSPS